MPARVTICRPRPWAGALLTLATIATACTGGGGSSTDGIPGDPFTLDLGVGVCFERPDSVDDRTVEEVPCAAPHDLEVIARFDLDDGDFPGDDRVGDRAASGCIDRFADYVGQPQGRSGLVLVPVAPDGPGWGSGERTVTCTVGGPGGEPLEGSVEGSERP